MTLKLILKVFIQKLVNNSPKGYHVVLKNKKFKYILTYIDLLFPQLANSKYNLGTKIYWLLNDLIDFPKCKHEKCNKILSHKNAIITTGYGSGYCSVKCEMNDTSHQLKLQKIFQEKYNANSYPESLAFKEMMHNVAKNRPLEQKKLIQSKKEATTLKNNGIKNVFCNGPIRDKFTKKREELHGSKTWNNPQKAIETRKRHNEEDKNFQKNINYKVSQTRNKHAKEDPLYNYKIAEKCKQTKAINFKNNPNYFLQIRQKTIQTNLKKLGCEWPIQNKEVRSKMRRKYTYDGKQFDSSPEIAYYIWLTDNNIRFEYHPQCKDFIFYSKDQQQHFYEPDFYRFDTNQYEDIKGDQFFKTKFKMRDEKMQCMKENNVRIIRSDEYQIYESYCSQKFQNKKWYLQFKNKSLEK